MDDSTRFRVMQVAEDAAEGCVVVVPLPPVPWVCDECSTRNGGPDLNCVYCGQLREDADE